MLAATRQIVVLSRVLNIMTEIARRPSYREYLWYKLHRRFGYAEPDRRWASLRLSDQNSTPVTPVATASRVAGQQEATGKIRDRLFEKSPYEDFDARLHPDDLQGWGSDDPVLVGAIQLLRAARVCEVGSWKGRSAIRMAQAAKAANIDTEIVCVDTWLGSPEHWLKEYPDAYESLRIINGIPHLYYTFLANVVRTGMTDMITPFPTTSENAAEIFKRLGIRFELIYIDAAHEYEPAKRDFVAYYDLLTADGLLILDDYIAWQGVTKAADEFVAERHLRMIGMVGKAIIPKGEKYANITFD